MTTFYLFRHGRSMKQELRLVSSSTTAHLPLVPCGIPQIIASARELSRKGVEKIVSSEVPRARETADIVGNILHLPYTTDAGLNEIHNGIYEDGHEDAFFKFLDGDLDQRHGRTPQSGEPFDALIARVGACMQRYHGLRNVVLVSHGHPIEAGIRYAKRLPYSTHVPFPDEGKFVAVEL